MEILIGLKSQKIFIKHRPDSFVDKKNRYFQTILDYVNLNQIYLEFNAHLVH